MITISFYNYLKTLFNLRISRNRLQIYKIKHFVTLLGYVFETSLWRLRELDNRYAFGMENGGLFITVTLVPAFKYASHFFKLTPFIYWWGHVFFNSSLFVFILYWQLMMCSLLPFLIPFLVTTKKDEGVWKRISWFYESPRTIFRHNTVSP